MSLLTSLMKPDILLWSLGTQRWRSQKHSPGGSILLAKSREYTLLYIPDKKDFFRRSVFYRSLINIYMPNMFILIPTAIKTYGMLVKIGCRMLRRPTCFEDSFKLPTRDNLHKRNYIHLIWLCCFLLFLSSLQTQCPCEQFRNYTFWNLRVATWIETHDKKQEKYNSAAVWRMISQSLYFICQRSLIEISVNIYRMIAWLHDIKGTICRCT